MGSLDGKVSLITAAAQGIGRATVEAFSRAGSTVIATDINAEKLAALQSLPNVTTRVLNVLDADAVNKAVAEIGRIDVLFNCAGVVHNGTVLEMSDKDLQFAFDLNVWAQIRAIKAVLPQMLERRDGCIINMATVASSWTAVPNRAAYSISGLDPRRAALHAAGPARALCRRAGSGGPGVVNRRLPDCPRLGGATSRLRKRWLS